MLLDRGHQVYAYKLISSGGLSGTVVDPKLVFQTALLCHASGIVLVHNHPSGNVKPSDEDITLTNKLVEGGKLLEIRVVNHIILSMYDHYSFSDEGLM